MKIISLKQSFLRMLFLTLLATSCSDFLDLEPQTDWEAQNFYSTEAEMDIALAGIYSQFSSRNTFGEDFMLMDYGTDEGYNVRSFDSNPQANINSHTPESDDVVNVWRTFYNGINLSNLLIKNTVPENFPAGVANKYIAEARFLRALAYLQLVSWWNEVPLRLEPTIDQTSNHMAPASLEDIYNQIILDFEFAANNLPHAQDADYVVGHANKMAAHGLLARTYLKMAGFPFRDTSKYAKAMTECEIIMNDGFHGLTIASGGFDGYKAHFLNYIENNYDTRESLFEISFANGVDLGVATAGTIGTRNGLAFNANDRLGVPMARQFVSPSPTLELLYADDDVRFDWNIPGYQHTRAGAIANAAPLSFAYSVGKFRRWEPTFPNDIAASNAAPQIYVVLEKTSNLDQNTTGINFPIIRYADVLLMYAEASNEVNNGPTALGIAALNQVRNRAGLTNIQDANPSAIANRDSFFNELLDERMRELCFEGLRKMDLIRWGLYETRLNFLNSIVRGYPTFNPNLPANLSLLRCYDNFVPGKHLSMPYPAQEVQINNLLNQKPEWNN